MSTTPAPSGPWLDLLGPNEAYVLELYERYVQDPASVDEETRQMFDMYGPPPVSNPPATSAQDGARPLTDRQLPVESVLKAQQLVRNIRDYGYLGANVNPMAGADKDVALLKAETYGLTEALLAQIPSSDLRHMGYIPPHVSRMSDFVSHLYKTYTGPISYEFHHVDVEERRWLTESVESRRYSEPNADDRREILKKLIEAEEFEKFLHRTFAGQKRFSVEGLETLVPMVDDIAKSAVLSGIRTVMIGMAHRGRLNVLAHVLGKAYSAIFSEFHKSPNPNLVPSEGSMGINSGWTGDVKYHLGASKTIVEGNVYEGQIILANNPSHLEFVNPVVEGYARAAQDNRQRAGQPQTEFNASLAVVIHGDAAFPGEGIVAETLNLSHLTGFSTGGTIHIIANNQLGFTANPAEGRSTRFASDLAKGFEIPIVHVSADSPEDCLAAVRLAHAYRNQFHKDFLIDLVGYRRWGHNEMDDPFATQPQLYNRIQSHPTARTLYAGALQEHNEVSGAEVTAMEREVADRLAREYERTKTLDADTNANTNTDNDGPVTHGGDVDTAVAIATLQEITQDLATYPADFAVNPRVKRVLDRRLQAFADDGKIDWAHAEALAFSAILRAGTPIRFTGQDSERGTFGQRHLVLHDVNDGKSHCVIHAVTGVHASFDIHNSPLSEAAVIGFEYGYSVQSPETLVIWEGQFGDFANAGQVIIDQFISSGRAKWHQDSSLVMLLPHGYEGQGPEHSSGRVERYLQMSADHNWRVANVTSAAQYFHLLRLQAATLKSNPRPLVLMTPKSLLRNPHAASAPADFATGGFQPVLVHHKPSQAADVRRLLLCSGKIAVELASELVSANADTIALASVEQLYPFPAEELTRCLAQYPHLTEVYWVQEEPKNMGAWSFVEPQIRALLQAGVTLSYVGRPVRSATAEGMPDVHEAMQKQIAATSLRPSRAQEE